MGTILEVALTGLTVGVNVGVTERDLSRRPQEFLSCAARCIRIKRPEMEKAFVRGEIKSSSFG